MKRILLFACCVWCVASVRAQQVEEFSLLRENAFVLNPALAGTQGYLHGVATFRKQFTSITRSPYTALLSMDGEIREKRLGVGAFLIHDVTGPTGKTSFTASVAYNIPLFKKYEPRLSNGRPYHVLSIGASLSVVQYRLQADQLLLNNANDPELYTSKGFRIFPDASFGVYYKWKDQLYVGVSVPQIMGLNINYRGSDGYASIKKVQHVNVLIGGKIEWGRENFSIEPVAAFRWVKGGPPQGDIGLRFKMYKIVWIGANYRSLNYGMFEAGLCYKEVFSVVYACDVSFAKYRQDIGMSHEVSLVFSVMNKKNVGRKNRRTLRF